ncbi:MAG: hypothetical protein AB7U97_24890 [Pirellulales bacterium]
MIDLKIKGAPSQPAPKVNRIATAPIELDGDRTLAFLTDTNSIGRRLPGLSIRLQFVARIVIAN